MKKTCEDYVEEYSNKRRCGETRETDQDPEQSSLQKLAADVKNMHKAELDRFASEHIGDLYNLLAPTQTDNTETQPGTSSSCDNGDDDQVKQFCVTVNETKTASNHSDQFARNNYVPFFQTWTGHCTIVPWWTNPAPASKKMEV